MSDEITHLVCPECREEYRHVVSICADCGVELVAEDSLPPDPTLADFPPSSELTCVRVAPLPWIRALSEALERSEVGHRIEPGTEADVPEGQHIDIFGDVDLFGLYVMPSDIEVSREVDESIAAEILPAAEDVEGAPKAVDSDCPACQARVPADADECPDCGIAFV